MRRVYYENDDNEVAGWTYTDGIDDVYIYGYGCRYASIKFVRHGKAYDLVYHDSGMFLDALFKEFTDFLDKGEGDFHIDDELIKVNVKNVKINVNLKKL